jgi:hypothetical protein
VASITRFYALILSTVLLLSGVPGFFPNIALFQPLMTLFALTLVHAAVHAGVGVLGLLITALASDESVRIYTLGLALLYGVLAAVGIAGVNLSPLLAFNAADTWLHGAIFVMSLGIFLAGLTEDRLRQRKLRILGGIPSAAATTSPPRSNWQQEAPFSPPFAQPVSRPSSHPGMMPSQPGRWSEQNSETYTRPPWQPAPADERSASNLWAQSPWPDSQPASQPNSQTAPVSPRDPWTREQRLSPAQPPSQPPVQPSAPPWPQYPPPQNPWSPSAPPSSQPSQNFRPSENPWAWEPQAPDQGQQP